MSMDKISKIPVTVLSGFLGAGKTTLLNRILTEKHGVRYAVIVNEFGEVGIDNELIIDADEEILEMNNGCVCCTIRGDLIRTLNNLIERPDRLDAIIIETTGLADPGPIAKVFFSDQQISHNTKLDAIVTIVDALHLERQLVEHLEIKEQIAFADVVLINKIDLVAPPKIEDMNKIINNINPQANLIQTIRCNAPLFELLNIGAFSLESVLNVKPEPAVHGRMNKHDSNVSSVSLLSDKPLDIDKFQSWFGELLQTRGNDILRSKGVIEFSGLDERYVFQGVHMLMEASPMGAWPDDCERISRMVFIGRHLESMGLDEGFRSCQAN